MPRKVATYTEDTLQRMKNQLPIDYARILQQRVLKPNGTMYTRNSIYRALTVEYANDRLIGAAMRLAAETNRKREKAAIKLAMKRGRL